jgi:chromate transport protein ChrA
MGLVKGMKWYLACVAAVVAIAVWYFGVSPIYFIAAGICVGLAIAIANGRKGSKR